MFKLELYERQDFSYRELPGENLCKIQFVQCDFSGADFTLISTIENCVFDGCTFASAELQGVTLAGSAFLNCRFKYANLFSTTFENCKMTGSSFLDADISAASIAGGDWSFTDLRHISFTKRELKDIRFEGADLSDSKLTRCKISGCDFSAATVTRMSLRDSDIRGSIIDGMDVQSVDWKNTKVDLEQCVVLAEALGAKYKA